jgi:hypothetical protein
MSSQTLSDMPHSLSDKQVETPASNTRSPSPTVAAKEEGNVDHSVHVHPLAQLGNVRKNVLLFIFAIATFVDICNVSGVAVAVAQIAQDTSLEVSQVVWIITS